MSFYYSPSMNAFYNDALKADYYDTLNAWPDDCIQVVDSVYQEFYLGFRDGFIMLPDASNMPSWEAMPPPSHDELVEQAAMLKQKLADDANRIISEKQWPSKLQLGRLSEEEKTSFNIMLDYLDALDHVDTEKAPDIEWPVKPE